MLFDVYRHKLHHATELSAIKLTVAGGAGRGRRGLTYCLSSYDPDFPVYGYDEILDCSEEQPELEALMRMAMVMHNQYPWDRSQAMRLEDGRPDRPTMSSWSSSRPRNREVREFIRRARTGSPPRPVHQRPRRRQRARSRPPSRSRRSIVAERFAVKPRSRRWPSSRASGSARTRTSSATRRTAGRP